MELGLSPSLEQTAPRAEHSLHRHLQIPGSAGRDGAGGFPWGSEGSSPGSAVGGCFPGRLINSIRVTCASYQDYQEWLYCLKTAQFRNADSSLSGSESFSGSKPPHPSQVRGAAALGGNPWLSHPWPCVTLLWHSCGTPVAQQAQLEAASKLLIPGNYLKPYRTLYRQKLH